MLRLSSPGHGWHDSLSQSGSGADSGQLEAWLVELLSEEGPRSTPYQAIMVEELTARGQRVGVVCVGRALGPPFTEIESALFRGASTAAALAVSNATLYRIQAEYAAVMQATGDAILAVDASGEIRGLQQGGQWRCSAATTTPLMGRSILEFAADSHRQRLSDQLAYTLSAHQEVSSGAGMRLHRRPSGGGRRHVVAYR